MILGIVGGIASGKSTVTGLFAEAGCPTVDADRIAHRILDDESVRRRIRDHFGAAVFHPEGNVDRAALAARVFGDEKEVGALNEITHPPVREEICRRVEEHRQRYSAAGGEPESVLVLDVSLLASSPLKDRCDRFVFVDASEGVRRQRCRERVWSPEEMDRRERHQATLATKKSLAHWTVENSGTLEETRLQVRRILEEIRERGERKESAPSGSASGSSSGPSPGPAKTAGSRRV